MANSFKLHSGLSWNLTAKEIEDETERIMKDRKRVFDFVGALKPDNLTYDNIIKRLADDASEMSTRSANVDFVQHVFDNKELRDASVAASKKLSEFDVELSMRKDVFDNLVAFEKTKPKLSSEAQRFIERLIKIGRRNGLHLSSDKQDTIKDIKKRLSDLCIDFEKNLTEEQTVLEFTKEELVGVPDDFIANLETAGDKLKVTLQYPHYFPVMKKAQNPETRRRMYDAFHSRCLEVNTPILEELVELRHKKAEILSYPTHAAFVLEMRMAKTPESVSSFLMDLLKKLRPLRDLEIATFLSFKKEEYAKLGLVDDGKMYMSDMRYYMNMAEEKQYAVDHEILKQYFPMPVVTRGLLDIYQELLGLTFTEVMEADVWHKDVQLFSVMDTASGDLLGYFYLDLYPRDGKFTHAANFALQPACINAVGRRQVGVSAMVANLPKPTDDHPALLTHDDVETFFHEFGHAMHHICSMAEFEEFSGTRVERDFLEAPSQMLENWVWEGETLRRMSAHHIDGSPIPDELLASLIKSRVANAGVFNTRQILLSVFDQTIHTSKKADTAVIFAKLCRELMGMELSDGTNMAASFGHLAGGYDAQYYGYMWSEVYSADMFMSRFKKEGIMNPQVGRDYRKHILEVGATRDADEMLRTFLGREPQQDAFLLAKGLKK